MDTLVMMAASVGTGSENTMLIQHVMTKDVVQCGPNDTVESAARLMRSQNVGCVVVTDVGEVKGIVTDRDITVRWTAEGHNSRRPVRECMTAKVMTVDLEADALEVADLMALLRVRRMPIVQNGRLVGLVSLSDIERALLQPVHDILYLHGGTMTDKSSMAA
jgi:signal-transduction protein with cAMP-binding, CBS, and nucleotidyltransferase domain